MVMTESSMLPLGTEAPGFTLPDTVSGKELSLNDVAGEKGTLVTFICNHCPFVKHVIDELVRIGREYGPRGIGVVAISSNDVTAHPDDSPERREPPRRRRRAGRRSATASRAAKGSRPRRNRAWRRAERARLTNNSRLTPSAARRLALAPNSAMRSPIAHNAAALATSALAMSTNWIQSNGPAGARGYYRVSEIEVSRARPCSTFRV